MGKTKEFDNILDECLERLLTGGETIEQCLVQYPEQVVELRPLLETALAAKKVSSIQPRPEFKERARYQFRAALQEIPARRGFFTFVWPAWATVVAIVLALLLSGGGTVALAANSMPDEPLYSVKIATEQVRLVFTFSDIGKADLEKVAVLAETWVDEEEASMLRVPTPAPQIAPTSPAAPEPEPAPTPAPSPSPAAPPAPTSPPTDEKGQENMEVAVDGQLARLRMEVERNAVRHPAMLREMLETAPESAKPALRRALAIAESRYWQALEAVDGKHWGK
jgi:hypothetical protein